MNFLSDRINQLSESATIAMAQKSRELSAQGLNIISLALGEPDFFTPDFVKEAAIEAIRNDFSKYTPVPGYQDLRDSICHKFKRDNGLEFTSDQIIVSNGAKQSIANAVMTLVNPGEEVLLPAPFWVSYEEIVKLAGGIPKRIQAGIENDFKITSEQLEAAITPKTKLIIFSSPCNPTGSVYSQSELEAMADIILKHDDLFVISDEIYEHINFVGRHFSIGTISGMEERTLTVNGVSKAFAMTGWRIGYVGAPKAIAKACNKMQGQFTSAPSSIAQRAAKAAVEADPSVTVAMRDTFKSRRDFILQAFSEIEGIDVNTPEGAFYVFPNISGLLGRSAGGKEIKTSDDFCMYLLEEGHVATVTGAAFGAPGYFRLSYAASDENLQTAMQRIKEAVSKLN